MLRRTLGLPYRNPKDCRIPGVVQRPSNEAQRTATGLVQGEGSRVAADSRIFNAIPDDAQEIFTGTNSQQAIFYAGGQTPALSGLALG
jgi:hypothetical protein